MNIARRLWKDEGGAVVSIELILIGSFILLGLIVGMAALRDSVNNELADLGGAVDEINQSYQVNSIIGHSAAKAGSIFNDEKDFCDDVQDPANVAQSCITFATPGVNETGANPVPSG